MTTTVTAREGRLGSARAARAAIAGIAPTASDRVERLVSLTLGLGLTIWLVLNPPGAWASIAALVLGLAVVWRTGTFRHQAIFMAFAVAAGIASLDYLAWRLQVLNLGALWIAVPLLLAEAFGILHSVGVLYTLWPRPEPELSLTDDATRRPVFIFMPTVNEGVQILRRTVTAAQSAAHRFASAYPGASISIVICNDGFVAGYPSWRDVDDLANELGVRCVTRQTGGGAKAGNIEHARQLVGATGEALLVIFDADQVAEPDFLLATVPLLADPTLGWVQTGQYYSNLDNPVARWAEDQQAIFYRLLCPGKSRLNAAFICGTNVVIRASALDEIGGLPTDSVTEDFAASLKLHQRWRSVFVPGVLATGLGPMDLPSYFTQQRRWAIGTLSAIRTNGREIFLPGHGLDRRQRVQYALAATHYLSGLKDIVFILSPVVFLLTGTPAVKGLLLSTFLWHFLPFLFFSQVAFWWYAGRITSFRGVLIGVLSAPTLVGALFTAASGRRIGFTVTAKTRTSGGKWRYLSTHLILGLLAASSLMVSAPQLSAAKGLSIIWVVYSILCLSAAGWLAWQASGEEPHARPRRSSLARRLSIIRGSRRPVVVAVATTLVASALGLGCVAASALPRTVPVAFTAHPGEPVRYGVSAPGDAGPRSVPSLDLSRADIIGRHQFVTDGFDAAWAQDLHAQGAVPWLTLHFGSAGNELGSGLLAIRNGVHDDDLRRWAGSLREFGRPVYLTVLQFVDANWPETSAVANGGVPQDVRPAWEHIRDIFQAAGATNVGFVWSPAFPDADLTYAPPDSEIDVVQLTVLNYADQHPGPTTSEHEGRDVTRITRSLDVLSRHHPGKPLLLEIGTSLPAGKKAPWLDRVVRASETVDEVVSVVYHEAPPDGDAAAQAWSISSDARAVDQWQRLLATGSLERDEGGR